jgi:UDP-2-acetamido-3-amino-2,3-dideoxy-glucuronate N-acetyltransferase
MAVHPTCIVEHDVEIGNNTLIGPFNFIRAGTVIGDNCKIGPLNCFEGKLKVGNNVRIGTHVNLGWYTIIEDYVFLAGHNTGANDLRIAYCRKIKDNEFRGYTIKRAARIGLGVIFMPGVVVGEESLVGTASLVTKNVKPMEIVYGVPAKHQGWVRPDEKILTV